MDSKRIENLNGHISFNKLNFWSTSPTKKTLSPEPFPVNSNSQEGINTKFSPILSGNRGKGEYNKTS